MDGYIKYFYWYKNIWLHVCIKSFYTKIEINFKIKLFLIYIIKIRIISPKITMSGLIMNSLDNTYETKDSNFITTYI